MKRILPALIYSAFAVTSGSSFAAETYALICEVSYTYDLSGKQTGPASGEYTFLVEDRLAGPEIISFTDRLCDTVTRKNTSETDFFLACETELGGKYFETTYTINRYSGKFEAVFSSSSSSVYLLHTGKCRKAQKQF